MSGKYLGFANWRPFGGYHYERTIGQKACCRHLLSSPRSSHRDENKPPPHKHDRIPAHNELKNLPARLCASAALQVRCNMLPQLYIFKLFCAVACAASLRRWLFSSVLREVHHASCSCGTVCCTCALRKSARQSLRAHCACGFMQVAARKLCAGNSLQVALHKCSARGPCARCSAQALCTSCSARTTCTKKLARRTRGEQSADLRKATCAEHSRNDTCAKTLAQTNLHRATRAQLSAQSSLHRAIAQATCEEAAKSPQLLDIDHAYPRRGSRTRQKEPSAFCINHEDPRRGLQSRAMTATQNPESYYRALSRAFRILSAETYP